MTRSGNNKDLKRILITGAGGFVGGALFSKLKYVKPIGVDFGITDGCQESKLFNVDLRNEEAVKTLFNKYSPDIVFHFAALTSPQRNEENIELATEGHIKITKNILNNLNKDSHLIFLSTDKVFDGVDPCPDEKAKVNPLWIYGKLKWECENIIQERLKRSHIFRLGIVHSLGDCFALSKESGPGSFIDKAIIDIKAGREVVAFDNVERCFVRLHLLVKLLEMAMNDQHYGIYHVGSAMMNYYDRIRILCEEEQIKWEDKLIPRHSKALPMAQNLNSSKLKRVFGLTFN